ncbi:sigma-70 family RNA polymerase sigma factor [Paenibacillus nanensis]|uniref:Sigma-70 family RNA polymerase sigma factor n=1 Tax=Paenibacillus nanensis TaxID=393251 RepID=A0A3A1UJN1_9BACL|nr:sigma-70 family RNA polymerase sigma factor [Paenibacillus nanensis]RIX47343.1 sigma-70 family RNA polymerase sigma factor [Paenibacillus nanensis]
MDEERQIVERIQKGDESALAWLMDRYGNDVLRTAALLLKDRHLAEDVSQEAFLLAFQRVNQFRSESSIRSWLLQISINLCRSRMRRAAWKRLFIREPVGDVAPEPSLTQPGSTGWAEKLTLREEIGKLPLTYREVIVLFYFHDMRTAEIAGILKEPEGTVKSKLLRARKRLKRQLEEGGWDHEQRFLEG